MLVEQNPIPTSPNVVVAVSSNVTDTVPDPDPVLPVPVPALRSSQQGIENH